MFLNSLYPVEFNRAKKRTLEGSAWTGPLNLFTLTLLVFRTKQGAWRKRIQLMTAFRFPSTRTTNWVRLILGSQYSLCENYIKRAPSSALRAETRSWYQSDPPENQTCHTDEEGASLACYQSTLFSGTSFFSQWYFPSSERSTNEILWEIVASSPFPAPRGFATRSHVLARLASLAQIGELARRLMHACSSWHQGMHSHKKKRRLRFMLMVASH